MIQVLLSRQELYDLVWTESMLSLSKKYAISDVGLRKKCKTLEIPLPNVGYWAKVQFGKKVLKRRPLGEFDGPRSVRLYLREESDLSKESRVKLLRQIEADDSINLKVPEKLSNPDKLIIAAKEDLLKSKVWKKNEGIVFLSQGKLNINVSPKGMDRALRFMDTLIKALRQRGHDFKIEDGQTCVVVNVEKFTICCWEQLSGGTMNETNSNRPENQLSGSLHLSADIPYSTRNWKDGKIPVEEKIAEIIVYLEIKSNKLRDERIERENAGKNKGKKSERKKRSRNAKKRNSRTLKNCSVKLKDMTMLKN